MEALEQPDSARALGNAPARGMAGAFATMGRGKQSIVLNLKSEAGKQAFFQLVRKADVVVQNFRPGTVERMGIGREDCQKVNPSILYVSSSGFGPTGPLAQSSVYDPVIQAASGVAYFQGGGSKPSLVSQAIFDKTTALVSAQVRRPPPALWYPHWTHAPTGHVTRMPCVCACVRACARLKLCSLPLMYIAEVPSRAQSGAGTLGTR